MCLTACILNRNGRYAYPFIRDLCRKNINNQRAWNLFAQIVSISQDFRHNKFCLRLILKNTESEALSILNGHNALVAGTYRHALGEYMAVFKKRSEDPLLCFCIALTLIHMASQNYATKRHSLVIQASAFLNEYLELRGECQESYYNLGRSMHQLNLLHLAEIHYKKALTFPPAVGEKYGDFDLTREIAYNLMCIYINSNSLDLAANIMQQYLVIWTSSSHTSALRFELCRLQEIFVWTGASIWFTLINDWNMQTTGSFKTESKCVHIVLYGSLPTRVVAVLHWLACCSKVCLHIY